MFFILQEKNNPFYIKRLKHSYFTVIYVNICIWLFVQLQRSAQCKENDAEFLYFSVAPSVLLHN